ARENGSWMPARVAPLRGDLPSGEGGRRMSLRSLTLQVPRLPGLGTAPDSMPGDGGNGGAMAAISAMTARGETLIEVRGLLRTYEEGGRERTVLRHANATVDRGEIAVLVGKSGTGKSTLLNLLSGIDLPSAGEVVIDGVSLTRLSERERTLFRRDRIGFVF